MTRTQARMLHRKIKESSNERGDGVCGLARHCGVTRATVYNWIKACSVPTSSLRAVSDYTGLSLEELL